MLPPFFRDLCLIQSSEANFASLLYHHLINAGVLPTQLCTEMYTANIDNYYKDCDKRQDNTALKLQHIRCVVEIKSGAQQHESGLGKYFESDLLCDQLRSDPDKRRKTQNCALVVDIEKLGMWASQFDTQGRDYVFLAIDLMNPRGFWPDNVRDTYGGYCAKNGVHMIYFAQGSSRFWHYPRQGKPVQIRVA